MIKSFAAASLGLRRLVSESDVDCEYPLDIDDEYITDESFRQSPSGELTKMSSALALFKGARILGAVLDQLYLAPSTYELSFRTIHKLGEDLDDWSNSLPQTLRLAFTQEKPSTNIISSRCPFLVSELISIFITPAND